MDRPEEKLTSRVPGWVLAALIGMLAAGLSSGLKPWAAAVAGAFLPADLAADAAAAHLFVNRISPYGPIIRTVHMDLTGLPHSATLPYFPHPPFSLIVGLPMGFMSFQAAALCWFGATVALLFLLAVLLHKSAPIGVVPLFLLLLLWPPVLYNLEKGQWSVLLAVLLALAWRAVAVGEVSKGAGWAAAAAAVKVFPVALGAYFLLRSARAALWFACTGLVLLAIPLMWIGIDALPAFLRESRLNLPYWESFPLVMFSIHGAVTRALVGGQWAQPFVPLPMVARVVEGVVIAGLVGLVLWTTVQARRGRVDQSLAFLTWLALLPLLNPLSLGHNGVLLALPIVVIGGALTRSGSRWHRWGWSLSVVLTSVPNQTVWRFAAPPAPPVEGLLVAGLPMWGALLLFLISASVALGARSGEFSPIGSGKLGFSPAAPATGSSTIGRREPTRSTG